MADGGSTSGVATKHEHKSEHDTTQDTAQDMSRDEGQANEPNLSAKFAVLKCLNPVEAVAHQQLLAKLMKTVLKCYMKGLQADPADIKMNHVTPGLLLDFKKAIMEVYEPIQKANHKEILKCIKDPNGECIWEWEDEEMEANQPEAATVQEEDLPRPNAEDIIHSLDQPLSNQQALQIGELFHSHACMLEYQAHTLMMLLKLVTELALQTYVTVLKVSVKLTHQITLPKEVQVKLKAPLKPPKLNRNERIMLKISLDPKLMEDWGKGLATLYLTVTYAYYMQKAICGNSNMGTMAKKFHVKLTALRQCINSCKYMGGSATSKKKTGASQ